jgi:hypothetical protein
MTSDTSRTYPVWAEGILDAVKAIKQMPDVALPAFAAMFGSSLIMPSFSDPAPGANNVTSHLVNIAFIIINSLFLAPLLIAVHRYVLLGEPTRVYSFLPVGRYLRFVLYAMVFEIAFETPGLTAALLGSGENVAITAFIIEMSGSIVMALFFLRVLVLFPAIAIDAPNASWRAAMEESKGRFWTLFFTFFQATVALVLICVVALTPVALVFPALLITALAAIEVFSGAMFAAIASRLYLSFAAQSISAQTD